MNPTEKMEIAFKLFVDGMSITKSAKEARVGERQLSNFIKLRALDTKRNSRKYRFDEDIFRKIDTEDKAYWLGFIYADGCVRKNQGNKNNKGLGLEIILGEKDRAHLVKFAKFIGVPEEIIKDKSNTLGGKQYRSNRVVINSTKMCEDLILKGVTLKKSLTLKFPSSSVVSKEMQRHFIRGYFDGDGSIDIRNTAKYMNCPRTTILGTVNFLENIKLILESELKVTTVSLYSDKRSKISYYQKTGRDARAFTKYMYEGSNVYLERKYELFNEFCRSDQR